MQEYVTLLLEEYCVRIQSQKRAVMQRAAKVLSSSTTTTPPEDYRTLVELFEVLKARGHELYRQGVTTLRAVEGTPTTQLLKFVPLFETLLEAFLGDVLMFELAADHIISTLQGCGSLSAETLRSYTYAAMVMPSLRNGGLIEDFNRSLVAAGKL